MAMVGVGMVMVSLTRRLSMTMSHDFFFFLFLFLSSALQWSQISPRYKKTKLKLKLDDRLKDTYQQTAPALLPARQIYWM